MPSRESRRRIDLRLEPRDFHRLHEIKATTGRDIQAIVMEEIEPLLREQAPIATRLRLRLLEARAQDKRDHLESRRAELRRIRRYRDASPPALHAIHDQDAAAIQQHIDRLVRDIQDLTQEATTIRQAYNLNPDPQPAQTPQKTTAPLLFIGLATPGGVPGGMWGALAGVLALTALVLLTGTPQGRGIARGVWGSLRQNVPSTPFKQKEDDDGTPKDSEALLREAWRDDALLARIVQRYLDQSNGLERLRDLCGARAWDANDDGDQSKVYLLVATDQQLREEIPPEVTLALQSRRNRAFAALQASESGHEHPTSGVPVTIAPGSNGNGGEPDE